MSDYTGPVIIVRFVGSSDKDWFSTTFHTNADDPEAIKKIVERYAEDGYKPDVKRTIKAYMVNGSLEEREGLPYIGPIGYPRSAAHLRP